MNGLIDTTDQMFAPVVLVLASGAVGLLWLLGALVERIVGRDLMVPAVRGVSRLLARADRAVIGAGVRAAVVAGQRAQLARQRRALLGQRDRAIALGAGTGEHR